MKFIILALATVVGTGVGQLLMPHWTTSSALTVPSTFATITTLPDETKRTCTESGTLRPCVIHTAITADPAMQDPSAMSYFESVLSAASEHALAAPTGSDGYSVPRGNGFHWNHISTQEPHTAMEVATTTHDLGCTTNGVPTSTQTSLLVLSYIGGRALHATITAEPTRACELYCEEGACNIPHSSDS
ncbi:hypothetical protein LTR53_009625 [Teratosphaeriaceae sp. CCFEE 6253]|nr:hypothetical protein LTR53_009625 [Teratosphaeriaceae sp. CCFEE 6253]